MENFPKFTYEKCVYLFSNLIFHVLPGLGGDWGTIHSAVNGREGCIRELGSHLLQVIHPQQKSYE